MEYLLGLFSALIAFFIFNKMSNKVISQKIHIPIFTQSGTVQLLKNYTNLILEKNNFSKTQSFEHVKKNSIKTLIFDEDAYWIDNGFLVTAKITEQGIDESTKKRVDTHSLDKVELDKITFIVDKLTEGNKDDSGNSGK